MPKVTPEEKEVKPVFHDPKITFKEYYDDGNKLFRVNLPKPSDPKMEMLQKACSAVGGQSSEIALALWCTKQMVPDPSTVNWPVAGLTALPLSSNKCLQYADMTEKLYKNNINWDTHFKSYEEIKKNMKTEDDPKKLRQNEEDYKWGRIYSGWYATKEDKGCDDRTDRMIFDKTSMAAIKLFNKSAVENKLPPKDYYPEEVSLTIF